jgi:short-subunit dehydrogenase
VAEKIKDLDISLLFLNAGVSTPGAFVDLQDNEIEGQIRVNVLQPIYLTKALLPQMLARK